MFPIDFLFLMLCRPAGASMVHSWENFGAPGACTIRRGESVAAGEPDVQSASSH